MLPPSRKRAASVHLAILRLCIAHFFVWVFDSKTKALDIRFGVGCGSGEWTYHLPNLFRREGRDCQTCLHYSIKMFRGRLDLQSKLFFVLTQRCGSSCDKDPRIACEMQEPGLA